VRLLKTSALHLLGFSTESSNMRLIDEDGIRAKGIDLHRTTIWRKVRDGVFPKPVIVGNRHAWVEAEVDQYIEGLIAKRDSAAPEAA
jgi:predicted DNA-binding transcriptional regulator AlpA